MDSAVASTRSHRFARARRSLVPIRHPMTRRVAAAYAISSTGSYFTTVAIAFAVLRLTGSAGDLGIVLACRTIPSLALTLIGGAWADRLPRNRLMAAADLASATAIGGAAVLLLTGSAQIWSLGACMAIAGMAAAFFRPATIGLVREIAADGELQSTNALLAAIQSGATILGPALAGLIVAATNPGSALCIDAGSFVISSMLLRGLPPTRRSPRRSGDTTVWDEIAEGYREVRSRTWLTTTIAQMAVFQCTALACVNALGPLVAVRSLGGAKAWGFVVTGFAIGTLLGSLLSGMFHPKRLLVASMLPALLILPTLLFLAGGGPAWVLIITQCLTGAGIVFSNTVYAVALQQEVPDEKLSRVYSFDSIGSSALYPLGLVAVGPIAAAAGLGTTFIIAAGIVLVVTVGVAALPSVRRVRRLPEEAPEPAAA